MEQINLPKLILNGEEFQKLKIIAEGGMGLTLGLTFKNNPTNYPLLICKLYKNYPEWIDKNLKNYSILYKNGISPKLLGIQITDSKYNYYCGIHISKKYNKCTFDNHIYYYEIAGICTLHQFIKLSSLVNFNNYNIIKKYIDIVIDKSLILSTKLNIIHPDLHSSNIMIYNKNSLYLFNKLIIYDKLFKNKKLNKKQMDYFTKLITNFLLNKNTIKGNTNKDLSKSTNKIKLSYDNKMDIKIIDCDRVRNINEIIKTFASKYDNNDKEVNDIFELIYFSLMYLNILKFLIDIIQFLNRLYKKNNNIHLKHLIDYCNKLLIKYNTEMFSKSKIYKQNKDYNLNFTIFNCILHGIFFAQNQEQFDILYNYLKNKQYIEFYKNEITENSNITNMTYKEIYKILYKK